MTTGNADATEGRGMQSPQAGSSDDGLRPLAVVFGATTLLHLLLMLTNIVWYVPLALGEGKEAKGAVTILTYVAIIITYNVFLLFGALAIFVRKAYMFALVSCCLAIVPLLGPCGIAGIPIGIWGIVALRKKGVRETFS